MNIAPSTGPRHRNAGTPRLVKVLTMLVLPVLIVGIAACDSNSGASSRGPYEGVPEGKPPGLGSAIPDPPEVVETKTKGQLPDFLSKLTGPAKDTTAALYKGAAEHYDQFKYIPCYCGCASYATPHHGISDCYVKDMKADGQVTFSDHSLTCGLCQEAAQMTLDGLAAGTPLKDIRASINAKEKYTGIWTDTPPIPGGQ